MQILLVDDDKHIQRICSGEFEDLGHKVIVAENGRDALNIYEREQSHIDIAIIDILLPDIDGIRVLRRMVEINPGIPKIMYSAYDYRDDFAVWASEAYIIKRLDMSELIAAVERFGGEHTKKEAKNKL